jgi:hypothetical protein
MIEGSCHCGAVRYASASAPDTVTDCNCSICRKIGVLWAYYAPRDVRVEGPTAVYMWDDKSIRFHHCQACGCATHWSPVDESVDRMGLNARLMDPAVLAAARVRKLDGAGTGNYLDE